MKRIIYILLLATTPLLGQTKYYLSPDGDNSDGLSDATAWTTIDSINDNTFSPGDSILFERGSVWRDEILVVPSSGTSGSYLYFGAYGTGDKPRILGSEQLNTWTSTQGDTIWQSAVSVSNPMTLSYWSNIFFEESDTVHWGHYKSYDESFSELDSAYKWCYNSNTIYTYSESDPDNAYVSVEAPQRTRCVDLEDAEYIKFDSIDFHYPILAGIGDNYATVELFGLEITNCHISHVGWKGSSYAYGIESHHSDARFAYNEINDCGRRSISLGMYNTDSIRETNVVIEHNHFHDGWHTTGVDCINYGTGNHLIDSIVVRYNYFEGDKDVWIHGTTGDVNDNPPSNHVYFSNQTTDHGIIKKVYVYNNVFTYTTGKSFVFGKIDSCWAVNNTIYAACENPYNDQWHVSLANNEGHFVNVFNNIIYVNDFTSPQAGADFIAMFLDDFRTDTATLNMDYNLWYGESTTDNFYTIYESGDDYENYNTSQWATYLSDFPRFEQNSPTPADPNFVTSSGETFTIDNTSPAYNAGTSVWFVTDDYLGNARDGSPDIGAYEYVEGGETPSSSSRRPHMVGGKSMRIGNRTIIFKP